MTKAVIIILMFCSLKALAQNNEQENVRTTIETFFEGFHKQDSTVIKQVVADNIILQSIGRDKKGNTIIKSDEFSQFLKSIVSIPSTVTFEEKILGSVQPLTIIYKSPIKNDPGFYSFWREEDTIFANIRKIIKDTKNIIQNIIF